MYVVFMTSPSPCDCGVRGLYKTKKMAEDALIHKVNEMLGPSWTCKWESPTGREGVLEFVRVVTNLGSSFFWFLQKVK